MGVPPPRPHRPLAFSFLHAADLHIDSALRGLSRYEGAPAEEIRTATRRAAENLVELALEKRVDFVLLAGDIYDGAWRDFSTGLFFSQLMGRLHEGGVPVVLLTGNHDAASVIARRLRLPPNVKVLDHDAPETHRLDDWNVSVHGQGFATRSVTENLAERYPPPDPGRFNVGLLHTAAGGGAESGHAPYAPCTAAQLAAHGYDYWALGHIHKPADLHDLSQADAAPIVFPGNTQGRSVRECGPRGCRVVTVDDAGGVTAETHPLDVVRWHVAEVDVAALVADGRDDPDDFLAAAVDRLRTAKEEAGWRLTAARVVFRGTTLADAELREDPHALAHEVKNAAARLGGVWVEKVRVETRPPDSSRDRDLDGPLAAFEEVLAETVGDPEALEAFADAALGDLRHVLARALPDPDDRPALANPDRLRGLLADAARCARDRLAG